MSSAKFTLYVWTRHGFEQCEHSEQIIQLGECDTPPGGYDRAVQVAPCENDTVSQLRAAEKPSPRGYAEIRDESYELALPSKMETGWLRLVRSGRMTLSTVATRRKLKRKTRERLALQAHAVKGWGYGTYQNSLLNSSCQRKIRTGSVHRRGLHFHQSFDTDAEKRAERRQKQEVVRLPREKTPGEGINVVSSVQSTRSRHSRAIFKHFITRKASSKPATYVALKDVTAGGSRANVNLPNSGRHGGRAASCVKVWIIAIRERRWQNAADEPYCEQISNDSHLRTKRSTERRDLEEQSESKPEQKSSSGFMSEDDDIVLDHCRKRCEKNEYERND
ncbi:uncharacterized protein LAESUDRAFT_713582 [Laetiporus sulphureus 93-53]|uniref:Uncharacterized protein n=1 Tax=Laetiporus sulphureus 93-53 TaxID=1314785 RepID=A0A165EPC2_9APHY|nr:uncharacterized protein LAESUDRAFT_713582 [Laetiporus sulphureus 93-53]KZT07483.1 hypothetical protein LAESUDRAFT_713582 [Laetiporus sulphureus 93-53]